MNKKIFLYSLLYISVTTFFIQGMDNYHMNSYSAFKKTSSLSYIEMFVAGAATTLLGSYAYKISHSLFNKLSINGKFFNWIPATASFILMGEVARQNLQSYCEYDAVTEGEEDEVKMNRLFWYTPQLPLVATYCAGVATPLVINYAILPLLKTQGQK